MAIRALVSDVSEYDPKSTDKFLVDANVWLWMAYSRFSAVSDGVREYQLAKYPAFIEQAKKSNTELYWCAQTIAEVAHVVERFEYSIEKGSNSKLSKKAFRKTAQWRDQFVPELKSVIGIIQSLGTEIKISDLCVSEMINDICLYGIDSYDFILKKVLENNSTFKLLTDDGDFAGIKGIKIYTAQSGLISKAKEEDRFY